MYDLLFGCSIYAWKAQEILIPMPQVPRSNKVGVGRNRQNKTDF
jgi:hypothetical protein